MMQVPSHSSLLPSFNHLFVWGDLQKLDGKKEKLFLDYSSVSFEAFNKRNSLHHEIRSSSQQPEQESSSYQSADQPRSQSKGIRVNCGRPQSRSCTHLPILIHTFLLSLWAAISLAQLRNRDRDLGGRRLILLQFVAHLLQESSTFSFKDFLSTRSAGEGTIHQIDS